MSKQPPLPFVFSHDQMVQFTHQYEGDRFPDGRPRVPDSILERMKKVTCEQAWTVLREYGYDCQYQGKWVMTHQDPVLVGRAVTCNFIPYRPDVADVVVDAEDFLLVPGQLVRRPGRDAVAMAVR